MNVVARNISLTSTPSEQMSMTALRRIADDNKPLLMRGSPLDKVINGLAIGVIAAIGITLLGVTTALTAFPPTTLLGVAAGIAILSVAKHCLFNSQNAKWYKELNGTDAKAAPEPVRKAVQEAFHIQEIPGTLPTDLSLDGLIKLTANNEAAATALIQNLSTDQIQALSTDQIQALIPTQLKAIKLETLQAISDSIGTQALPDNMSALFSSLQALHHKEFVPTEAPLKFDLKHPSFGFLQILNKYSVVTADVAFGQQEQVNTFCSTFIPEQVYTIDGNFRDTKEYQQDSVYGQLKLDIIDRGEGPAGKKSYWLASECVSRNHAERNETNTTTTDTDFIQSLHDKIKKKFGNEEERTLPILLLLSQASDGTVANILAKTCVFPDCITLSSGIPELKSTTVLSLENKTYTCTTTTPVRANLLNSANSFTFTLKIEDLDTQDMKNLKYTLTIQSTNPKTTLK